MRELKLVTWNVLHRIHAVNWKEHAVVVFPDETVRVRSVCARIAELDADVVCLQEVSAELLAVLRARADVQVFSHRYPRAPALRVVTSTPVLTAPEEYLVTLVREPGARVLEAESFANDGGKGALLVALADGVTVLNTHVTWGPPNVPQLELLESLATGRCVVAGDFNAPAGLVHEAMGPSFSITALPEVTPTRLATHSHRGLIIDHVLVRGGTLVGAQVLTHHGESDHFPLQATVHFS